MWKPLQKSPPYFITFFNESKDFFYVGVTDYTRYWLTNTSKKSFLNELKKSNDGLEFDDENELVERGIDMLRNPETLKRVGILNDESEQLLKISMIQVYEVPLKLEIALLEASAKQFSNTVVQPLLKTICDLRSSQRELRELLLKKDREIEEYKIEGKAPRRLITTVYDDAAHMLKHTTYEEHFGAPGVSELLETTAFSRSHNEQVPAAKLLIPSKEPVDKAQKAAVSKPEPENHDKPTTADCNLLKIEKFSQNSLKEEIASTIPTEIEESETSKFLVNPTVIQKTESNDRLPTTRKRPKTKLNY